MSTADDGGGSSVPNEDNNGGGGDNVVDPDPPTRGSHLVEKSLNELLPMVDDTLGLNGKSLTIMNDFLDEGFTYAVAVAVDELGKIPTTSYTSLVKGYLVIFYLKTIHIFCVEDQLKSLDYHIDLVAKS